MSSRYQKVLPQLTPSTSVLDTRSTTPDVTPALQFAQQLQTNLDELSVIKTPNHLAGDAEFVKRGYLDPINEAKNKAIESFKNNNIAEGVQGLRDIKGFMLQSQQQGGVYSQIENNYKTAAEYTKQLEEGYTKGTYQDWQINYYKKLVNNSKSFNDDGEYVSFESSTPAQAIELPEYFNDLAKDWGKTAFSNYRLTSDGLFYDMSSGTRVTKEEVKAGLIEFMKGDMKAQSYYKEMSKILGEDVAASMFNSAMNAAADKEEFSQINPHYVRNPLIDAASSTSTKTNKDKDKDGKPILDGLLGKQVVIPGVGINMDEIPSKLFLHNGDLITPIGGMSGGYRSIITKEKVKVKDANLITSRDMELAAKDAFVEQFKEYPASNDYKAVSLDQILTNDKFKTVKENLQRQAPGLLETARRFPVEEYRKTLAKGADYNGNDYNQFLLKKYQQLNDAKTGFFNMIQPMAKNDKLVVSRPNGETINYETFRDVEIPNLIANHGLSIIELVNGKGNPMNKKGLESLKQAVDTDSKKIKILGTFQNEESFNPFAGRYVIEINNKQYVVPGDTETARKNGSLTNIALHSVFKNNGSSSPLGSPVGTTGSYTDSEYLFTTLFLANNPNIDDIPPIGGQFIISMDDKYDKNNKLKNFNIDTYDPENSDVKIIYKAPNGTKYAIPQNMYNLSDLTNLGRYNDSYISDPTLYQTFNNYLLQLNQQ
jgi:hypothetical protein